MKGEGGGERRRGGRNKTRTVMTSHSALGRLMPFYMGEQWLTLKDMIYLLALVSVASLGGGGGRGEEGGERKKGRGGRGEEGGERREGRGGRGEEGCRGRKREGR